ncbi:hypothetical protein GQ55_2G094600 [Panicum hallii var. hallii]|uniref:Uncharacterized protein n=1 Tax=Panicum hallii var. hallii TaxID=1504633 RepID=A0A2T7EN74_9POAL|nr:hypothetical protein GQ55_2G094600 [Panicum hallii var. hallii]
MPSFKPPLMCCMAFHVIVLFRITRFRQGRRRFKQAACGRWIRARGGLQAPPPAHQGLEVLLGAAAAAPRRRWGAPTRRPRCSRRTGGRRGRRAPAGATRPAHPSRSARDDAGVAERGARVVPRGGGGGPVHGGVAEQAQPGGLQGRQAGETTASRAAQELLAGEHRHCRARTFGSGRIGSPGGKEDERNGGKKSILDTAQMPTRVPLFDRVARPLEPSAESKARAGSGTRERWVIKISNGIKNLTAQSA